MVTSGDGVVTTADRKVRCGANCAARYKRGAVVTLTASPGRHFHFRRWSGGCVGTAPKCIVALDRAKTVRASFVRSKGTVRMAVGGPGQVVSEPAGLDCGTTAKSCNATFPAGTTLRLTARPDADGAFEAWGGTTCAAALATPCEFVVGSNDEVSAAFGRVASDPGPHTLNVIPVGGAHVVSDPAGIDCPAVCSASFASETRVTLRAGPVGWSGACAGLAADCIVVVDETMGVTAEARPAAAGGFGLNVSVSGPGLVSGGYTIRSSQIRCGRATGSLLDCEELFPAHRTVKLRAVPRRGAHFARWRGFCRGKRQRCSLRVTAPKTVLAYFRR